MFKRESISFCHFFTNSGKFYTKDKQARIAEIDIELFLSTKEFWIYRSICTRLLGSAIIGMSRIELVRVDSLLEVISFNTELVIMKIEDSFLSSFIIKYNNLLTIVLSVLNSLVIWKKSVPDSF